MAFLSPADVLHSRDGANWNNQIQSYSVPTEMLIYRMKHIT
jgi:hypothetical protein